MPNNALIYRKPSKWPIGAAVTAAVLIHLSAVAIAFHQESPSILPEASVIPFWIIPPFPPLAFQTRNTPAGSHPDHFRANRRAVLKYRTSSATAFAR